MVLPLLFLIIAKKKNINKKLKHWNIEDKFCFYKHDVIMKQKKIESKREFQNLI